MKVRSLKLVYFSPTGTTKAVVQGISRGIDQYPVETTDITRPDARMNPLQVSADHLLVIGVPVYMGRVPALITEWLRAIRAQRTPVVCVVVYGNRVYDDALLELKNIMTQGGCRPIACAAYVGEHSYSDSATPIAAGRPDARDLRHSELFGRRILERLASVSSIDHIPEIRVPGVYPYRGNPKLWIVDFIAVSDECTQCGVCAEGCPTGAIDPGKSFVIDTSTCITCCACIKHCPNHAKTRKPGPVKDASMRLSTLCRERKQPELFF